MWAMCLMDEGSLCSNDGLISFLDGLVFRARDHNNVAHNIVKMLHIV
jgi:hypothetical protein